MSVPDLTPKDSVRPFFRGLAWFIVVCSAVGAAGALWAAIFETGPIRERIAHVVLSLALALAMWTFLLAALGRNVKPPGPRLNVLLTALPVVCLAGIAWEYFSGPLPTREIIWLALLAVLNIAWLYSSVTDKSQPRSFP